MIHAREDYNRIQDPAGKIGADEPVFLLRSKDKFAPATVRVWAELVDASGDHELSFQVRMFADEMEHWQRKNGSKTPDSPEVGLGKGKSSQEN